MKAVVLAAGRGSRLGELTRDLPKPLLCIGSEPILSRTVRSLAASGVTSIAIVTGYRGHQIRDYFAARPFPGVALTWLAQPVPEGTARAVALAQEFVGSDPFLFAWGDIVVEPANFAAVAALFPNAALAVNAVDDPCEGGAVYIDGEGNTTRLVEKPPRGTSATNWNNAGFGILPADIWHDAGQLQRSPRGEFELPAAIGANIARGGRFRAVPVVGPWFDIGTPASLAAAREAFGGSG